MSILNCWSFRFSFDSKSIELKHFVQCLVTWEYSVGIQKLLVQFIEYNIFYLMIFKDFIKLLDQRLGQLIFSDKFYQTKTPD